MFFVDPDIRKASTLPGSFYTDPKIYERGLERFFAPSWQFLGDTSCIKTPGSVYPLTFLEGSLDEPVLLTRDMDDKVHFLSNVCTHRWNMVCQGAGNERFLRCRYHGRRFDLCGKFQSMPEFEGVEGFPTENDNLKSLNCEPWGPLLFGSLANTISFQEVIAPMQERLSWLPINEFRPDPTRARDYLVRAHWALYADNYLEGLHIPFVHAGLNQALDFENYSYELWEHGSLQLGVASKGEPCFDLPVSSLDHGRSIAAYYYWLFPNTMLNFYPWGLSVNVVRPLGPELTKISFIPFVWKEERMEQGAGAGLDRVEREDEAVVEFAQKGVNSRFFNQGRYSPKKEAGTHHFHSLIAARLREETHPTHKGGVK